MRQGSPRKCTRQFLHVGESGALQRIDVGPTQPWPVRPKQVGMGDDLIPRLGVQAGEPGREIVIELDIPFLRVSSFHKGNIFHQWNVINV